MTANGGKENSRAKRANRYQRFIGGVIIASRKALKALDEGISKQERAKSRQLAVYKLYAA